MTDDLDDTSGNVDAGVLRERVGALARQLVRMKFDGPNALFDFQLQILDLLIDTQAAIKLQKTEPPSKARAEALGDLRFVKAQTYETGNALAWLVLGLDRQALAALRANRQAPPPKRDASLDGVKAVSGHLAAKGHGFPLLHDITTCLRIGDVTFVDVSQTPRYLWTCEIKTTQLPSQPGAPAGTVNLEVNVISVTPPPPNPSKDEGSALPTPQLGEVGPTPAAPRPRRPDRRIERQLARMREASAEIAAPTGEIIKLNGNRHFIHVQRGEGKWHQDSVRALSAEALEHGWTAAELEPGVALAAIRIEDADDVGGAWMKEPMDRVTAILVAYAPEGPDGVSVAFVPSGEATGHIDALPHHLLGLDEDVVVALSTGRLVLVLAVRVSAVYAKLEQVGLTVRHNGTFDLWGDNATASRSVSTPEGDAALKFHFVGMVAEALREFHTLEGIAKRISEALDAIVAGGVVDEYLASLSEAAVVIED